MTETRSLRGRVNDNEPNPVDVHVGNRIRLRRTILHITQQQMAEMLGLTFQQIQKYEKGKSPRIFILINYKNIHYEAVWSFSGKPFLAWSWHYFSSVFSRCPFYR